MELINRKLGDGIHIKHGFAFLGEYFSDQGEYIILTPGNFFEEGGFKSRPEKDRYYAGVFPNDYLLKEDDLIVAMTEQGPGLLGSSAFIPEDNTYLHNQRLGLVDKIDEEIFDKKYLFHLFNSHVVRGQIYGSATGTKVRHTSPGRIYKVKVLVPDAVKQKQISSIVEIYSQLIDTNRRRIQLLEEAARLLFREWFVYFRFPWHEKVKVVDGVPEGWKKRRLVEVAKITMGQSPKSEYYNDNGVGLPFHQGVTGFGNRYPTNQTYCTQKNRMAHAGDILFSVRAPVGRINISTEKIIIGRGISAIRSKEKQQSYLFYELKNHFFKEDMIGGGAIFASITKKDLETVAITYPDEKTIEQFENITNPIDNQIGILSLQNQKLAQVRDLLLPRLMSGKIEV